MKSVWIKSIFAAATLSASSGFAAVGVDPTLPEYTPTSGVSGNLKSIGSDTMNNLMAHWAESFYRFYPNVKVEIEGKGSSTAPAALTAGTAHFGPMSRPMKDAELDAFEKKFGYKPVALRTAFDGIAIYVHKDNPIKGLTLQQVDAIFSKTRRGGFAKDIKTWGDLGLTGEWADKPISLYGRNSASGTYGFFKEVALFKGDYKDTVKEQPGSSSVVQGVASDKFGIGYSGVGYKTADVRFVPLAHKEGDTAYEPLTDAVYAGDYPLARFLLVYLNKKPGEPLDPLRGEFARFAFSKGGQEGVVKDGYIPVPNTIAVEELRRLGLK